MAVTGPTEYRAVASAFNRMSAALAESNALRQRMTSDIAHELRAPVSVMRAQLEAMLDGVFPLSADQLAIVYDETLHLGRLIEDLRTLTRAEAGRLPLNLAPVDPAALAQRLATEFLPLAQDQQIALDTAIAPDLPPIQADADRLRQVFSNLLANALAHTPSGGRITVSAQQIGAVVRFGVADTGPGLTPEQAAHVFERFYRTDDARQRDQGGSGLGLAIAHELVRLHGGRIAVSSAPGAGSTFTFDIPIVRQNSPAS
jgi:signal transduction histidine kinase